MTEREKVYYIINFILVSYERLSSDDDNEELSLIIIIISIN